MQVCYKQLIKHSALYKINVGSYFNFFETIYDN